MNAEDALDLLSFGEALVDFFPEGKGSRLREVRAFTPCLGGAPANVAYGFAKLGGYPAFMSVVGDDEFGALITEQLAEVGVDVSAVGKTMVARTGLTFVQLDPDGERSFLFYRNPSADMTITAADVDRSMVRRSRVVHVGTNLLMTQSTREATSLVLREGRDAGALVSLDANLRPHLWDDPDSMREAVLALLSQVALLKANAGELAMLFGNRPPTEVFATELTPLGVEALVVTHGGAGAQVVTATLDERVLAPTVAVVDTTGAGDGFMAGLLLALARMASAGQITGLLDVNRGQWRSALMLANLVGGLVCTQLGAVTGIPDAANVPYEKLGIPAASP